MFSFALRFHNTGIKVKADNEAVLRKIKDNLRTHIASKNSLPMHGEIIITKALHAIDLPENYRKLAFYHNVQLYQSRDKGKYFVTDGFLAGELNPTEGISKIFYAPVVEKDPELISPLFFTVVLIELLRHRGLYYLHAGAVSKDGKGCILIAGEGNTGKTTLTTAFVKAGYFYLGDDAVFVSQSESGELLVSDFARDFQFMRDTLGHFSDISRFVEKDQGYMKLTLRPEIAFRNKLLRSATPEILLFPKVVKNKRRTTLTITKGAPVLRNLILCSQQVVFDNIIAEKHLRVLTELASKCRCYITELGKDLLTNPEKTIKNMEETLCQYQR